MALLQLAALTGRGEWQELAEGAIGPILKIASRYPTAFGLWLCAGDLVANPFQEIAIVGDPADPRTQALVKVLWSAHRPAAVVAQASLPLPSGAPPLLADRPLLNGQPTAYVCRGFICQLPVNDPEGLRAQLEPEPAKK
jgi:uncharacterized protein YyaL (SSP411 family)